MAYSLITAEGYFKGIKIIIKGTGRVGNQEKNPDHHNYSIIEIGYREESWRHENTYCHSDSSESPPANDGVKNSLGIIMLPNEIGVYSTVTKGLM